MLRSRVFHQRLSLVAGIALLAIARLPLPAAPPVKPSHASVRTWSSLNGLAEESIFQIAETVDGQIWLATRDGLVHFDDQSFYSVNLGLRNNSFGALFVREDSIWAGGREVLAVSHKDAFQSFINPRFDVTSFPRGPKDYFGILEMSSARDGKIWIVRSEGVYLFDPAKPKDKPVLTYKSPSGDNICSFHEGRDGREWIGTDSGLFERINGVWRAVPGAPRDVRKILLARSGTLWIYGADGIRAMTKTGVKHYVRPEMISVEPTRGLIEDRDGNIWVGIMAGVIRIRPDGEDVFDFRPRVRSDDLFQTLLQTVDGSIWAGSKWGSLARVAEPEFNAIDQRDGMPDSSTSSVVEDTSGRLWLGARSSGIFYVEQNGKLNQLPGTGGHFNYAMAALPQGSLLYLDTLGLHHIENGKTETIFNQRVLAPGYYRALSKPTAREIYMGDSQKLYRIPLPIRGKAQMEPLAELSIPRTIIPAADGIWAISWDRGVFHYQNGRTQYYPLALTNDINGFTMFELSDRYFLIGTNAGIMAFDRQAKKFLTREPLFPQEQVFTIQPDLRGNLWLGCRRALLASPLAEVRDYFLGKGMPVFPLRFTAQQGLPSVNFGLGTSSISHLRSNGELWFASVKGAIYFKPEDLARSGVEVRCAVSGLLANGIVYPINSRIVLPAGTTNIEVRYTVLGGRAAEQPVFRYRLQTGNDPWTETSVTSATFSRLSPGEYRFEVQGRTNVMDWASPIATLPIVIEPFWYQRPAVIATFGVAALVLLVLGIQYRRSAAERARQQLEKRVAERTAELALARQEAVQAAEAKANFLATMSHEIRTPMNGVIGMLDVLRSTPLNEEQQRILRVVASSGNSLVSIVNDILNLAKIESGRLEIEPVVFSLQELVENLRELFEPQASAKGIAFQTRMDASLSPWRMGDVTRLTQILTNLISNAIKFTASGEVLLAVDAAGGDAVRFVVRDTGIGIPQEKLSIIFEPFTQADSSTNRRFGGTGLGLAICQRLAELMHGTLAVESKVDQGSTFTMRVALARAEAPSRNVEKVSLQVHLSVLVVEDNAVNRHVASSLLKRFGCVVKTANDGFDALTQVEQERFDLIFMDCHMPGLDGFEATRRIRALDHPNAVTPIVAISAGVLKEEVEKCREAGMNAFLAKPLRSDELANLLEALHKKQEGQPFGWPTN